MRSTLAIGFGMAGIVMAASAATPSKNVTFHKDVLPVLQKNCQGCHRPGEAAPMAFLTYQQTRPWAKAIKAAVAARTMPPWFADPAHGKWSNDRRMSQAEIDTLLNWADAGAPEGKAKDAPKPLTFTEGWAIGKPDMVFEMPQAFDVPSSGTVDYQYVIIPTGLTQDKWVQMAEARPGNRKIVHHIIAFVREPGSKWLEGMKPGVPFAPRPQMEKAAREASERAKQNPGQQRRQSDGDSGGLGQQEFLVGFAPGSPPEMLQPGKAKLLKAGSDLVLQMHYTATGTAGSDKSSIGLVFAKEPVKQRVLTSAVTTNRFKIPAGAESHAVSASMVLQEDADLVSLLPHMHLRGKAFEYRATYPTGETEVLLKVPAYRFDWQLWYEFSQPKRIPKGTKLEVTGVFDNSANNRFNPDPKKDVTWGEQSWEEMMMGFFDVAIDVNMNPMDLYRSKQKKSDD
ncbi:MAG: thiol-disulfide isomerase [Acidobacteria bacterium]|nr:thiol-disulfide isomerase [Acidobacteriota bacterium]